MNDSHITTLVDIENFINSTDKISFKYTNKQEVYKWIQDTLIEHEYITLPKPGKTIVKKYIMKMTGYSRAQTNRLISHYKKHGYVKINKINNRHKFRTKYTKEEIRLLAKTDDVLNYPNGYTLKTTLMREYTQFGKEEYKNLSNISVSYIYYLRNNNKTYKLLAHYEKTKSVVSNIGERLKPNPNGKPGYLRIDSVHQGDKDGVKGLYHINIVDDFVQFEFVMAVERISYRYLKPVLLKLLELFPYVIIEFHSDNGSEYINKQVARLLNELNIRLTKSRPRKSNDNALVESKNGSVIRKWMGYMHIPPKYVDDLNKFYTVFNEYLNYHRPCAFPSTKKINSKGKVKKVYKLEDYMTPYDKLKSIKNAEKYLKPGITFEMLDKIANRYSDTEMAELVQKARDELFSKII